MIPADLDQRPRVSLRVERVGRFHWIAYVQSTTDPMIGARLHARTSAGALRRAESWADYRNLRLVDSGERYNPKTGEVHW